MIYLCSCTMCCLKYRDIAHRIDSLVACEVLLDVRALIYDVAINLHASPFLVVRNKWQVTLSGLSCHATQYCSIMCYHNSAKRLVYVYEQRHRKSHKQTNMQHSANVQITQYSSQCFSPFLNTQVDRGVGHAVGPSVDSIRVDDIDTVSNVGKALRC